MKKGLLLAASILLLQGSFLFAKNHKDHNKGSVVDFNLQLGANTTLTSVTDYADNMKNLAEGISSLENAYKKGGNSLSGHANAGSDLDKTIKGLQWRSSSTERHFGQSALWRSIPARPQTSQGAGRRTGLGTEQRPAHGRPRKCCRCRAGQHYFL